MNKFFASAKLISVAAIILLIVAVSGGHSQSEWNSNTSPLPATNSAVNDYVGVFDEAAKAALEQKLRDFRQRSGVTLVVAVVKTTGDRPIFDYSLAVARGWKVGSKDDDNPGALTLIAVDDRKYFTQISRDLEDELPDALAGSIQRQYLVPEFRKGNYAKGITDTLDVFISTIDQRRSGAPTPTPAAPESGVSGPQTLYSTFCCLVVIGFILLIIFANRGGGGGGKTKRDQDRWGGGFGGGGSALPWIIGSAIGSSGGSSSSDWGSSSSGGSSDWGGFGGGDFGGGGAGGDW